MLTPTSMVMGVLKGVPVQLVSHVMAVLMHFVIVIVMMVKQGKQFQIEKFNNSTVVVGFWG